MDGAARLRHLQTLLAYQQACRRLRTWRDADRLLVFLSGIPEPEQRLHRFGEHLKARQQDEAAWTVARLHSRVVAGDPRARQVCLGLLDLSRLERVVGAQSVGAIRAALQQDRDPSAGLFAQAQKRSEAPDDETFPRPKDPVGYRISLARRPVFSLIDRLLFDPDARVVRTILGNPRLTEGEVVKLAASRRTTPEVLEAIAEDDRWITRYAVKVALANNPVTPSRMVLGLLPYLMHQDLRELASGSTHDAVRDQAATLLARRRGV